LMIIQCSDLYSDDHFVSQFFGNVCTNYTRVILHMWYFDQYTSYVVHVIFCICDVVDSWVMSHVAHVVLRSSYTRHVVHVMFCICDIVFNAHWACCICGILFMYQLHMTGVCSLYASHVIFCICDIVFSHNIKYHTSASYVVHVMFCICDVVFNAHWACYICVFLFMYQLHMTQVFIYEVYMSHVADVKLCSRYFVFTLHRWYCVQITQVMSSTRYSAYVTSRTHDSWAMLHTWYCVQVQTTHESCCICEIVSTWFCVYFAQLVLCSNYTSYVVHVIFCICDVVDSWAMSHVAHVVLHSRTNYTRVILHMWYSDQYTSYVVHVIFCICDVVDSWVMSHVANVVLRSSFTRYVVHVMFCATDMSHMSFFSKYDVYEHFCSNICITPMFKHFMYNTCLHVGLEHGTDQRVLVSRTSVLTYIMYTNSYVHTYHI